MRQGAPVHKPVSAGTAPKAASRQQAARRPAADLAGVSKRDLDDTLEAIAPLDNLTKKSSNTKSRKKWSKKKKIIVWSITGILSVLLLIGVIVGIWALQNGNKIFQGGVFDAFVKKEPLQRDANGRSNIVIFGTSEDDEGHKGALLTDSIMILSVNQDTGASNILSIPRDLWVEYDQPCSSGNQGKINAVYVCALENNGGNEEAASKAFMSKLTTVTGLDVQYYARLNYTVIRDTVNSLGGIEVNIDSRDPRGIYDINTKLTLPNGVNQIDGETALKLSRARNAKGGYGLERSNFDREKSQRLILKGVQKKALSTGTLANPVRVMSLLDSLGNNVHTNVKGSELQTVIKVAAGIQPDNIDTISLSDTENSLVQTDRQGAQSIVRPVKGLLDYSGIIEFVLAQVKATDAAKAQSQTTSQ